MFLFVYDFTDDKINYDGYNEGKAISNKEIKVKKLRVKKLTSEDYEGTNGQG